jgi:ABC-type transport system involved in multi-copper enzyme maturation permease subunit
MFWNTLSVENTKNLKRRALWIELGILALLIILVYTIIYATMETNNRNTLSSEARQEVLDIITWPGALLNALSFGQGNSLGGILLVVLVGAVTAQEYTWRTMHLWLSRGIPRFTVMGAKFVATVVPIVLIVLTTLIIGGGLSAIFTLHLDKTLHAGQINLWQLLLSVVRTAYTLLPYGALTFMLAVVTRSTAAAIGIGLAYTLLVEGVAATIFTLVGGVLRDIVVYLPGSLADGLLKLNQSAMAGRLISTGDSTPLLKYLDPIPCAIGLAVWTLLFFGIAVVVFRHQDLSD